MIAFVIGILTVTDVIVSESDCLIAFVMVILTVTDSVIWPVSESDCLMRGILFQH